MEKPTPDNTLDLLDAAMDKDKKKTLRQKVDAVAAKSSILSTAAAKTTTEYDGGKKVLIEADGWEILVEENSVTCTDTTREDSMKPTLGEAVRDER